LPKNISGGKDLYHALKRKSGQRLQKIAKSPSEGLLVEGFAKQGGGGDKRELTMKKGSGETREKKEKFRKWSESIPTSNKKNREKEDMWDNST